MARTVDDWAGRLDRSPIKTITQLGLLAIGIIAVFVIAIWGIRTGFSYWWGRGAATQEKNSSQNWIAAQRTFHQDVNDVTADQAKIASAKKDIHGFEAAHPSLGNGTPYDPLAQQDGNLRTTLQGLQQQCQNTVAGYNTDAQSYLTEDWRDADLPEQLSPTLCE